MKDRPPPPATVKQPQALTLIRKWIAEHKGADPIEQAEFNRILASIEAAASPQSEALPCPFCGAVGLDFSEGSTFRWLAYSCSGCGIGSETRVQTLGEGTNEEWAEQAKADAIEEWNRRAIPQVAGAPVSQATPLSPDAGFPFPVPGPAVLPPRNGE